jgi:uncharacterized tellurite resistance protein B-like protein
MEKKDKIQICKVVAQAVLADGLITDSEREFLDKLLDKYQLDDAERKDVLNRNFGDDPGEMARAVEAFNSKNEMLVELALAVAVDGEIARAEMSLLIKVATVLDITEAELDLLVKAAIS